MVGAMILAFAALASSPPGLSTQAGNTPTTDPADLGPNVVMLKELADKYDPVPFEHRKHAKMAEMREACLVCHHRPPTAASQPVGTATAPTPADTAPLPAHVTQADSAQTPACKSCHSIKDFDATIQRPSLKGAYHRQCFNCHREWMGANACGACHKARDNSPNPKNPTPGDIVGRMHPPIPQPEDRVYKARYTPADGVNVTFRHQEHTKTYGIKCCHLPSSEQLRNVPPNPGFGHRAAGAAAPGTAGQSLAGVARAMHELPRERAAATTATMKPARPPRRRLTMRSASGGGQKLDKSHAGLACQQCHAGLQMSAAPTCGDKSCHGTKTVAFPATRPGLWTPRTPPASQPADTQPTVPWFALTQPAATSQPQAPTWERIRR